MHAAVAAVVGMDSGHSRQTDRETCLPRHSWHLAKKGSRGLLLTGPVGPTDRERPDSSQ